MPNLIRLPVLRASVLCAIALAMSASVAAAEDSKPSAVNADSVFGSRSDKPDGSTAMTIGRRLPIEWDTKVGTDVSLAAPSAAAASENLLRGGAASDRSSGAVWGNITMPGLRPLGFDKTSVDARLDAGKDEGKLGATLSRSVPINETLSVTLQNSYSVRQSLASAAPVTAGIPPTAAVSSTPAWGLDESVRLNVDPLGTTLSAAAGSSTLDSQWHNKLSLEQTLAGPLKLTTSVEDAGTAAVKKSITAGFKQIW
jgi:hypothetical protein